MPVDTNIEMKKELTLKGIGVSPGIAIGKVYSVDGCGFDGSKFCHLGAEATDKEIARFRQALRESKAQLKKIKTKLAKDGKGMEHQLIIDAHIMIASDDSLKKDTIKIIQEEKVNAEWALKSFLENIENAFANIDDEYIKERSSDIGHIINRIIVNLSGAKPKSIADLTEKVVVVAHDLSPTDTAQMVKGQVLAFLTDLGGTTSHTAIIGRSLEIPAVVGLENITGNVSSGDLLIVDGREGLVIVNPSDDVVNSYKERKERYEDFGRSLQHYRDLPSVTTDGHEVTLLGNMEIEEEVSPLLDHGAEGIGLYRSEFLYLNRGVLPSEEEHLESYSKIIKWMEPHVVTIRTLDVGGDKVLPSIWDEEEENPAMGLRAIRFCFKRPDIFKTQLRAILRAGTLGPVRILIPMVSSIEEVRHAKEIIKEVSKSLKKEGVEFNDNIEVGVMIEVPSAAITADTIAKEVDFFSIGTNDLLQYSLAIDRVNEHVAYLYQPFHPAVLKLIKGVVESAHRHGITVCVCGEMAGVPEHALLFLGFGIDQLSMSAYSLLRVKRLIRSVSYEDAKNISEKALEFATAREIEDYIGGRLAEFYSEDY